MASLSEFFSDPASAGTWTVVPDQSTVAVKSKSFWGVMPVKGRFTEFSGDGQVTAPQTVSGHIDIKAASLRTGSVNATRTCTPPISLRPRSSRTSTWWSLRRMSSTATPSACRQN